jgi:DNA-directed RNA polymerase subunit RPC12/RpoP
MALKNCEECGKEVSSKAKTCPNCGFVLKKKTSPIVKVIVGLLGFFIGLSLVNEGMTGRSSSKPEAGFKMPSIGKQIVVFDEYQKIQNGMTYKEVVAIIGAEGEELSRNKIDGVPGVMQSVETIMYQWVNSNGSNMNAIFQNDRLFQKAQFGL